MSGHASTVEKEVHIGSYNWRLPYKQQLADARARLADPVYAAAWAEGQALTLEAAQALVTG